MCLLKGIQSFTWLMLFMFAVFKELQKESEFQRKEWFRKQGKTNWLATPVNKIKIKNIDKLSIFLFEQLIKMPQGQQSVCTLLINMIKCLHFIYDPVTI